jgi:caffeoyl-CoA O-methyltransferase
VYATGGAFFKSSKGLPMNRLVPVEVEAYAEAHSIPESSVCRALCEETHRTMEYPQMLVGPLEGAFLKMMTKVVGAKRVLEIGMFTGYSALCFAEALPEDGTVITCEINEESAAVARRYFAQAPYGSKVSIRMGPALDTMRTKPTISITTAVRSTCSHRMG